MKQFKAVVITIAAILGVFFAACGGDSGTDSDKGADADEGSTQVETIYDLGDCRGANEGVTKYVTSEHRYYKCENGGWEVTEATVQSNSSEDFQDKKDSTRKWPEYQDSAVLEEAGVSPECAAEFEGSVMTYNGKAYRCYNNFWRPEKDPPKDTTTRVVCLKTTDPNAPLYCYLDSAIWNEYVYKPDASDLTKQAVALATA